MRFFFTQFGEYSVILILYIAATKNIIPLAFPSFNVDSGLIFEKIFSTEIKLGLYSILLT